MRKGAKVSFLGAKSFVFFLFLFFVFVFLVKGKGDWVGGKIHNNYSE